MLFLDDIGLLESLTNHEKQSLSLFCQEKTLKEGEYLFYEGDEANALYLLKEGKIRILKNINGKEIVLGDVKAEEILGEMALFCEKGKRMATAKAACDSTLITILSFSISELTKKHPELLNKIKNIIEERNIINKTIVKKIKNKE